MTVREATFTAARWTTISAFFRVGLQLLQVTVLARLLVPADFGLMAVAGAAVTVTTLFSDMGLSSALMHFPRPDRVTLSTLFWLNLVLSILLALLFVAAGWPLAIVYGHPDLAPVLASLSASFPLTAIGQQFRVLAEKDLRFQILAQNDIASAVGGTVVALAAAICDFGVFALAAAVLASASINSLLAWWRLSTGQRPTTSFRPALARPFIAFGLHRVGDGFWNTARMQADIFIAGLFAAPAAVAAYAVPRDLTLKIANAVINPVITRVGLPVMTRARSDPDTLRSLYLRSIGLTASLNFPIYAVIALFPEQIVSLFLGNQWETAAFFLRVFALWGLIRSTGNPSGSLLYAVGMARRAHFWNLLLFFSTVPLLWLSTKWGGLPALAWTMLTWQALVYILTWRFLIYPACGIELSTYNASIARPLGCTVVASGFGYGAVCMMPAELELLVGSLAFSVCYLLLSYLYNRQWIEDVAELLRVAELVRRRRV